jgi:Fe2+ transport system protein FeoA
VRISRISDRDPEKLRAVERLGLTPGRQVLVVEESVWEGPIVVSLDGARLAVPLGLARAIRVEGVDAADAAEPVDAGGRHPAG